MQKSFAGLAASIGNRNNMIGRQTVVLLVLLAAMAFKSDGETFSIGDNDFILDRQPFQIRCGEIHFARIPREYWGHRLRLAHAMGLNTVCAYLFWNLHEPENGKFNFAGNADAAEFCRLAQAEGLKVILRPGPYSCAEWDFGGLPYWLLKIPAVKLRTQDPRYLAACKRYLLEVGKQLAPLQITHGGPIIMVQVENEYGSYGNDQQYISDLRDTLKAAAFDVPFFTCNGPADLKKTSRDDIFSAVNFGGDPQKNVQFLRDVRPEGPLMVSEFYPGWFDSWGKPHHTGESAGLVRDLGWMLEHNVSFSLYMAHGGTSFGFDAGANSPPFSPQVTSYDYDAPISEAGWDTPKFYALRDLFLKHLQPGEKLPDVPKRNPVIQISPIQFKKWAPLFANLPAPKNDLHPQSMEMYGQAHGAILYRTQLAAGDAGQLRIIQPHDYCLVFLDGKKIATLDRRFDQNKVQIPPRSEAATLDVLVDTFGHINYGPDIYDPKGITQKVEWVTGLRTNDLGDWQIFKLPFDDHEISSLKFEKIKPGSPAFYRGSFYLAQTGDTFLDLSSWGKGMVWVNGHNLGRFWNIGPQQTLYCPAPWLKTGHNEITVFDLNGPQQPCVAGLTEPILKQLND
jgi:beta-galactosidase